MEGLNNESAENMQLINKLQEYLKQGYLLHGSKRDLEILTPQQATDNDPERQSGKAEAVYAADGDVRIPILMALFDMKDKTLEGGANYSYHAHSSGGPVEVNVHNNEFTPGYVYVLPSDTFEIEEHGDDRECISRVPVTPLRKLRIKPSILNEFERCGLGKMVLIEE